MNIVLYQPEIPHNTGAIGRTCLMTGSGLYLIRPYGFFLDEKALKRAGLDYWHKISVREYDDFSEFLEKNPQANFYFVETDGDRLYTEVTYKPDDFLIFGSETVGLPVEILQAFSERVVRIPMIQGERSVNLSVAAGIVLYEALRQTEFVGLC
ncbi:MAG: tRNA (cytidine(34)-2'-O)-methyltransferase [Defluviitaleaceae bacterium]|nr:tRNA (cytidine(34)-2'-O)-methyltransferase [Defluviitaleaceae bacterium]